MDILLSLLVFTVIALVYYIYYTYSLKIYKKYNSDYLNEEYESMKPSDVSDDSDNYSFFMTNDISNKFDDIFNISNVKCLFMNCKKHDEDDNVNSKDMATGFFTKV